MIGRLGGGHVEQVCQDLGLDGITLAQSGEPNGSGYWRSKPKQEQNSLRQGLQTN